MRFYSLLMLALATLSPAHAGLLVECPTCSSVFTQAQELANQINTQLNTARQLENEITQAAALPTSMFTPITSTLNNAQQLYYSTQSLGSQAQNLVQMFDQKYPGFQAYLNQMQAVSGAGQSIYGTATGMANNPIVKQLGEWSDEGRANTKTALQASDLYMSTLESDGKKLSDLVSQSQGAAGRNQILQVGNQIAAMQIQQLQQLKGMMDVQLKLMDGYLSQQQKRQDAQDAAAIQFRTSTLNNSPPKTFSLDPNQP